MPATITPPSSTTMLDDLHTATGEHGQAVRDYMIGCLAALLEPLPGGPDAWANAVETASRIAADAAARRATA